MTQETDEALAQMDKQAELVTKSQEATIDRPSDRPQQARRGQGVTIQRPGVRGQHRNPDGHRVECLGVGAVIDPLPIEWMPCPLCGTPVVRAERSAPILAQIKPLDLTTSYLPDPPFLLTPCGHVARTVTLSGFLCPGAESMVGVATR